MRILVGTLYSNENEFDQCIASIERQTYRDFEHMVIQDLPNQEAHEALYGTFMRRKDEFDLLVKVDADMVLCSSDLFERIVAIFREEPNLELLSIAVHDYLTDRLMWGLNTYRNTLQWEPTGEMAFTDRVDTQWAKRRSDSSRLAPAAKHCPNPSLFQAFHFGLHRGVKCREAMRRSIHLQVERRSEDVQCLWRHFIRCKDCRVGLASLASELALAGQFDVEHISYSHPYPRKIFQSLEGLTAGELMDHIRVRRRQNWGFLPWRLRMEAMRGAWLRFAVRCVLPNPMIERISRKSKT